MSGRKSNDKGALPQPANDNLTPKRLGIGTVEILLPENMPIL